MRYLILFILMLMPSSVWAASSIDVFINGVHYPSIEAYHRSQVQGQIKDKDHPLISTQTAGQLKSVGIEQGVGKVIVDFTQDWQNPMPKFVIAPHELEEHIKALVDGRKEPVLIVTGDNKLRVMGLKSDQ